MHYLAFLEDEMPFVTVCKLQKNVARWRQKCWLSRSKFDIFVKFDAQFCKHNLAI